MNELYRDKNWLYQKYWDEKLSTYEIVKICKVSNHLILHWMRKFNIPRRKAGGTKLPYEEASFNTLYSHYKSEAKKRGLKFNLTKEQFRCLTKQNCYYCGVEPKQVVNNLARYNGVYVHNGIDRVDNNEGYVITNCVPCCKHCNWAKHTFTTEEFKQWIRRAYKHMEEYVV